MKNILDKLQRSEFGAVTNVDSQSSGEKKFQTLTIHPKNFSAINREEILNFINSLGLTTYRIDGRKGGNPVTKLFELARLLNQTGVCRDALDEIKSAFVEMIRAHVDELREATRTDNFKLNAEVIDLARNETYGTQANLFASIETDTDRQFEAAKKFFGDDTVANEYRRKYKNVDDPNAAKLDVILFANNPACMDAVQKFAERKFKEFDDKYHVEFARKKIPYESNFCLPEKIILTRPDDGVDYDNHLFVDDNGTARIKWDSDLERDTLKQEQRRKDFFCWLRNEKQKPWALCLPRQDEHNEPKNFFPDMLIFRRNAGSYVVDILEPHRADLTDNLSKAKALANYAANNPIVGRVELIRQDQNFLRRLDMKRDEVREKVLSASTTAELDDIFKDFAAVT